MDNTNTNERTHHESGFSKWPMWNICSAYESDGGNDATKAGTAKHQDFEESLNEVATGVPALHSTDGAAWAASVVADMAGGEPIHSETRVEIQDTGCPELRGIYGYCDAWFVKDGHLTVVDYKSGGKGELDYMPQLQGYAFALLSSATGLFAYDDEVTCVVLYGADHAVVTETYTADQLAETAKRIVRSVNEARDVPNPVTNCGPQCRYCKHRMECPSMSGNIERFKRGELADMSKAKLWYTLTAMKAVIEAELEKMKTALIESGEAALDDGVYRYELKTDSRGKAKSTDIVGLCNDLAELGLDIQFEDVAKAVSLSKTALRDIARPLAKSAGITLAKVDEVYASHTEYGTPATKLVRVGN